MRFLIFLAILWVFAPFLNLMPWWLIVPPCIFLFWYFFFADASDFGRHGGK
jgi:hypothetical protein